MDRLHIDVHELNVVGDIDPLYACQPYHSVLKVLKGIQAAMV